METKNARYLDCSSEWMTLNGDDVKLQKGAKKGRRIKWYLRVFACMAY